ncbi:putative inorganic phosphate cotransporter [Orussus abietinus]|uniref:putative inorganic phosphate cotransporter n=1 Tax=Orussus abietinus TaxID=222816 RepID=UPI0006265C69|nr:putative inorganic phosphate cotransporter [Orussus abietinus]
MGKGRDFISCRDVLWYLVFSGFAVNYILRINLNLVIVGMVVPREKPVAAAQCALQGEPEFGRNSSGTSNTTSLLPPAPILPKDTYEDRFTWNEYEQGLALGAYYWLHWTTQLPGGLLARKYGTKLVFGFANIFTAILGLLIPIATRYHLYALVFIRVLQGLVAGVAWPSMHDMTSKWIPPDERSKFVSAYLGSSVGAAVTYPLCAACVHWFGWDSAFYVTSLVGIAWYCFWALLAFDSPQQHPRISSSEKKYILERISGSLGEKDSKVPWKDILTSGPLWITIASHWGGVWGFLTLMTQAPSYFNFVHGWNINSTGILSGLPHVLRMAFSYAFSILSDWLLRTKRMSRTNVRKLATFVCTGLQGILTVALAMSGCHPNLAIIFMMAGTAVNGAVSAGTLAIFVDLSPNYASVLLGFAGLVTVGAGFISPLVVGLLTNNNQTIGQWRLVFVISAVNLIVSCLIYIFFGSSDEQEWNNPSSTGREPEELTKVKSKSEENADVEEKFPMIAHRPEKEVRR